MLTLFNNPLGILIIYGGFLLAITVHEFAHAYISDRLGDPTARVLGRLTLNPIPHIDLIGTLLLPLFMFLSGSPIFFGWAKPVPYDPYNLRNPRRDSAVISLAGPAANIILAIMLSVFLHIIPFSVNSVFMQIGEIFVLLIRLNVVLAIFNLIPIHPLDGFAVVRGILPEEYARQWADLEPYGFVFLLFLVFPIFGSISPVSRIITPIINLILSILLPSARII